LDIFLYVIIISLHGMPVLWAMCSVFVNFLFFCFLVIPFRSFRSVDPFRIYWTDFYQIFAMW